MITAESPGLSLLVARLAAASDNFPRDLKRALGTQRKAVRTEAVAAIRGVYNIGPARVRQSLKPGDVNASDFSVTLSGGRAGVGLRQFGARQLGRNQIGRKGKGFGGKRGYGSGVSVQVLKGKPREVLRHAFFPRSKQVVLQRVSRDVPRLPVEALFGPSVADMLNNPAVFKDLSARFVVRASRELSRLIANAVAGRG